MSSTSGLGSQTVRREKKRRASAGGNGAEIPWIWDAESEKHVGVVDIEAEGKLPLRPDLYPPRRAGPWLLRAMHADPPPAEVVMWLGRVFCEPLRTRPRRGRPPMDLSREKALLVAACVAIIGQGTEAHSAARQVAEIARRGKVQRPGGKPVDRGTIYEWWKKLREHGDVKWFAAKLKDLRAPEITEQIVAALNRLANLRGEKSTAF